jgi:hypothetical protein
MTTFADFARDCPAFKLCGGPFGGRNVPTSNYQGWPSEIVLLLPAALAGPFQYSLYRMRVGDLVHYDYVGDR